MLTKADDKQIRPVGAKEGYDTSDFSGLKHMARYGDAVAAAFCDGHLHNFLVPSPSVRFEISCRSCCDSDD